MVNQLPKLGGKGVFVSTTTNIEVEGEAAMKFDKREDRQIKYQGLYWLRIKQRCSFIATEVGGWSADILGINEKKMIELEVKISKNDLLSDYRKPKHAQYNRNNYFPSYYEARWIPTHFYYVVPPDLVEVAKEYLIKKEFKSYGIISSDGFSVVKRASWLHEREPDSRVKFMTALRMGSELLRFHEAWV